AVYTTTVTMGGSTSSCTVTLSVSPNPLTTGATPAFSGGTNPFTASTANFSRTLTISTATTTAPGAYPFTVTASKGSDCQGGGTGPTVNGTLVVTAPPNITSPNS